MSRLRSESGWAIHAAAGMDRPSSSTRRTSPTGRTSEDPARTCTSWSASRAWTPTRSATSSPSTIRRRSRGHGARHSRCRDRRIRSSNMRATRRTTRWPTSFAVRAPRKRDDNVKRLALIAACALSTAHAVAAQDGSELYAMHCTRCHDSGMPRVPSRTAVAQLAPERIVAALETGTMREQGAALNDAERRAIAVFVTGRALGSLAPPPSPPRCADAATPLSMRPTDPSWNAWGAGSANNRFQTAASAGLTPAQIPTLQRKWAFGFAADLMAAAQPAVIGGRVFVGSTSGRVFALNLRTGCTYWMFDADTMVRTAISIGDGGGRLLAHFGDIHANAYAVDASTGALVWKRKVDEHAAARITGAPTLHAGRLYVPVSSAEEAIGASPQYECCTFRGSVVALDASTGSVLWKTYIIPDPPKATRTNKVGTQLYGPSGAAIWS